MTEDYTQSTLISFSKTKNCHIIVLVSIKISAINIRLLGDLMSMCSTNATKLCYAYFIKNKIKMIFIFYPRGCISNNIKETLIANLIYNYKFPIYIKAFYTNIYYSMVRLASLHTMCLITSQLHILYTTACHHLRIKILILPFKHFKLISQNTHGGHSKQDGSSLEF